MKISIARRATARRGLSMACAAAVAAMVAVPQSASAHGFRVPQNLQVPSGYKPFLAGHAIGTQNYICLPSGSTFAWAAVGPQATVFGRDGRQVMTHFLSVNPDEPSVVTPRPAWQHSRDTSAVWAQPTQASLDPAYVQPGAVPWLLLTVVGSERGPGRGDTMTKAAFIHRINTVGGPAPGTGCSQLSDVGRRAFVPYEADYVFYRARGRHDD